MLLSDIIPISDSRKLTRIPGKSSIISVIDQLRMNDFDPLLVESSLEDDPPKPRVVSGFSIISKIAQLPSSRLGAYLESPASESSLSIGSIDEREDLVSLLHVFETTTLGFAEVHRDNRSTEVIIFVKNLLRLYDSNILSCDLVLNDVASSPLFSLSKETKLEQTLREMLNRKFRRVQIADSRVIVSEREILSHLFQKDKVRVSAKSPERLLDGTLEEIEIKESPWLEGKGNLRDAAKILLTKNQDSVLTERGLITPWDLTIKAWRLGELRIADQMPK
jgi:hypothetical protein